MYLTVHPLHGPGSIPDCDGILNGVSLADHMCCYVLVQVREDQRLGPQGRIGSAPP